MDKSPEMCCFRYSLNLDGSGVFGLEITLKFIIRVTFHALLTRLAQEVKIYLIPWYLNMFILDRFIPESFRWYYGHDRIGEAERVIKYVSEVNRHPTPDMSFMEEMKVPTKDRKYTVLDLFRTRFLVKVTLLLAFNW